MRAPAAPDSPEPGASHAARGAASREPGVETRLARVEALVEQLVAAATGGSADDALYATLRRELLTDPAVGPRLPRYVRMARELGEFSHWIRDQSPAAASRRELIWLDFGPILERVARLDGAVPPPLPARSPFDMAHVHAAWRNALERRATDPVGALAAARTLLEDACRHVLDGCAAPYPADADLPSLYRLTAEQLQLASNQQAQPVLPPVLDGCRTIVDGLGAASQHAGDLTGRPAVRATARYAELAVGLAGSIAVFLVATFDARGAGR